MGERYHVSIVSGLRVRVTGMSINDQIILKQILDERRATEAPEMSEADYFEYFVANEVLKDYDLDHEEIMDGVVAGGNDGGMDGFYVLVNGSLIAEDYILPTQRQNIAIDIQIIQAKRANGFEEAAVDRFKSSYEDLFDLSNKLGTLAPTYNSDVLDVTERFRSVHKAVVGNFPDLRITYSYVTLGEHIHQNTQRKVKQLERAVKRHHRDASFQFNFLGASDLLTLARQQPKRTFELKFIEQPISAHGPADYLCVVNLNEYGKFITDDKGALRLSMFDANVRDYQNNAEVNRGIKLTLDTEKSLDFWWMNNGITVLGTKATVSGKTLTIEDPQIVNGYQTSREVYDYLQRTKNAKDERNIVTRILVPEDDESRYRIIKATNSQTPIPYASLRATDTIHRNIEDHLQSASLFYDRKKGQYRNLGKPVKSIISIPALAQAVLSVALRQPDGARARPSSLLKDDETYADIYSNDHPVDMYLNCALLVKRVEEWLRSEELGLTRPEQNNIKFYLAMHVGIVMLGKPNGSAADYASIDMAGLTDAQLGASCKSVLRMYKNLGGNDRVAKGPELTKRVLVSAQRAVRA